jgi:AcrR family transcriptional regulator
MGTSGGSPAADLDGRRARSERSRLAAVEAMLDLLEAGATTLPGAADIAERSGLSERTVFRLFDDLESLYAAAVATQAQRLGHLFTFDATEGPVDERVEELVDQRVRLFEAIRFVRPVAERLRYTSTSIGEGLRLVDRQQRRQLAAQFEAELASLDDIERTEALDALHVVSGWAAWDTLRRQQGRSVPRATAAMRRAVRAVVESVRA